MKKIFIPALFVLLISLFATGCGNLQDPEMKGIENVRISRFGLKESTLFLNIHYYNPNNFRIKLKKAEGDAWVDGNPLGHFSMDTLVHIMPRSEFRLPVKLQMDMTHFAENMSAAFLGRQVQLKIKGTARAGKGFVFINYPIEYEGKESLNGNLKWEK